MERATGGVFQYRFASERDAKLRGALVDAWRSYGLTESKVYSDAASAAATGGDSVDIWFFSPDCGPYSKRNHSRSSDEQAEHTSQISKMLAYVSERRPCVAVIENVPERCAVDPLSGAIARVSSGYSVEYGVLDPRRHGGCPMKRERAFWVMVRDD